MQLSRLDGQTQPFKIQDSKQFQMERQPKHQSTTYNQYQPKINVK